MVSPGRVNAGAADVAPAAHAARGAMLNSNPTSNTRIATALESALHTSFTRGALVSPACCTELDDALTRLRKQ
jgi:hypothetical protein